MPKDQNLVKWILAQGGKDLAWLQTKLGLKPVVLYYPRDKQLIADIMVGRRPQVPAARVWRLVPTGKWGYKGYAVLGNNCNTFTCEALDEYVGYKWARIIDSPNSMDHIVSLWDEAVSLGKDGRPQKESPWLRDCEALSWGMHP
jgi:hypothetical protein